MAHLTIEQAMLLALQHSRTGRLTDAENIYRQILADHPTHAQAACLLGDLLTQTSRADEALLLVQRLLETNPDFADAHYTLGNIFLAKGQYTQAISTFRTAIQLKPDAAEAHNKLAFALNRTNHLDEAVAACRRVVEIRPDSAQAYNNLGNALVSMRQFDDAIRSYRRAIEIWPDYSDAHNNLGFALRCMRRFDDALSEYRKAIELQSDNADAHWNLAHLLLLTGDFHHGWAEYEWRYQLKGRLPPRNFGQKKWEGASLNGDRILLHNEQGFGDTIQFVRYASLVASRGGRVILYCQPPLKRLLSTIEHVETVVTSADRLPDFEAHCPLLSLPKCFATDLRSIPGSTPYLEADRALIQEWAARLTQNRRVLKVGLVWAGSPTHLNDRNRSIELSQFSLCKNIPNVVFYSLQKGKAAEQIPSAGLSLVDFTPEIYDFADTAAFISNLDLIISVDTAVAHLAGALNKPVWLLLPFVPDWRWMLDRDDSPWYPTMRLFRQTLPGDWNDPIQRIAQALRLLAGNRNP